MRHVVPARRVAMIIATIPLILLRVAVAAEGLLAVLHTRTRSRADGLPAWMSEDSLCLSVFAPETRSSEERLPVMVWIHGGGFTIGSGSSPQYNGQPSAKAGRVVVVSINYRLGAFGFLGDGSAFPANLGLADQIFALEWVRDEIRSFGGDPGNVTIFGESAGGVSVSCLLGSPKAKGLFHKAIPQSGACVPVATPTEARATAAKFARYLGLDGPLTPERLRAVPVRALLDAMVRVSASGTLVFRPVIGAGPVLPIHPLAAIRRGIARDVALFGGCCAEENRLFTLALQRRHESNSTAKAVKALAAGIARSAAVYELPQKVEGKIEAAARAIVDRVLEPGSAVDGIADLQEQPGGGDALYPFGAGSRLGTRNAYAALARVSSDVLFDVPLKRLLDAHAAGHGGRGRTYCYQFAWQSPAGGRRFRIGSCHALEMGFHFGFVGMEHERVFGPAMDDLDHRSGGVACRPPGRRLPTEFTRALNFMGAIERGSEDSYIPEALRLSKLMVAAWANFARDGDPTVGGQRWPQYSAASPFTVVFGEGQRGEAQVKPAFLRGAELALYEGLFERVRAEFGGGAEWARL